MLQFAEACEARAHHCGNHTHVLLDVHGLFQERRCSHRRHVPTRPRSSGLAHRMPWPAWQHAQPVREAASASANPPTAASAAAATCARCAVPATTAIAAACAAASASAAAAAAVASAACCLPLSTLCRHVLRKGVLQRRSSGSPDLHSGCHLFGNRTQLGMLSSQPLAPVPSCPVTVCAARSPCAASASASEVGCLSSHAPVGGAANAPLVAVSTTSASAWLPLLPLRLREPSGARGAVTSSCSRARWLSVRSAVLPHG